MSPVARYVTIRANIPTIAILPFNDSALLVMQSLMVSFKKSLMGMNLLHIDDFQNIHIEIHQGCIRNYRETTWKGWCLGLKILSHQRCIYRYQRSGFSWLNSQDSSEFKSQSQAYWVFKKTGFHTQLYPQPSDLGCSPLTFASAFRHTPTWHEFFGWLSCWKGKEPSWNRFGLRYVEDIATRTSPSYSVIGVDRAGNQWHDVKTDFSYRLPKEERRWWHSQVMPVGEGYPAYPSRWKRPVRIRQKKAPEGAVDRQRFGMAFYRASTMALCFRTPALEKSLVCIDHRFRIVVEPAAIHQVEHPIHIKIAIAHVLP